MLKMFLEEQAKFAKPQSHKVVTSKLLINPDLIKDVELDEYEYICKRKPKRKRVEKYLQGLIDEIIRNQD